MRGEGASFSLAFVTCLETFPEINWKLSLASLPRMSMGICQRQS